MTATGHAGLTDLLAMAAERGLLSDGAAPETRDGVILRDDAGLSVEAEAYVDCAARMPVCRAVCCRLTVQLSAEEVESGKLTWDPDRPYLLKREADGRCTHLEGAQGRCAVYGDRPQPCRRYSCVNDRRIWRDFDGWVLNTEWLEANLGDLGAPPSPLITLQPLRSR